MDGHSGERYAVVVVEGFPITATGANHWSAAKPGLSATVFDTAYHRAIAMYRSEAMPAATVHLKRDLAVRRAEKHAAALNRWHESVIHAA